MIKDISSLQDDAIVGWLWMGYKMMVSGASKDEGRILRCDGVKWGVATG